ncbi:hypothetical protein BLNAU_14900 [Blattamonas nauphoetae]|uniref:Uncharacterized protein n=1 Tax=Blattamonas nauphoetae TaxID=2049346 RepID=A0ABQ9XH90_9EUKA|nr:hypothetical protein BLNAU_14900 [Blattamonas nauphoetae]
MLLEPQLVEPFLNFSPNSRLSFEDKSTIYNSLVVLVKSKHPFDEDLQDRAVSFLNGLIPWGNKQRASELIDGLVPSSAGPPADFIESFVTLFSSPYTKVVAGASYFLGQTTKASSVADQNRLVESDFIPKLLATAQPHTLPNSVKPTFEYNRGTIYGFLEVLINCTNLADPYHLHVLGLTAAIDQFSHREMIFQKVILPSSLFVTYLCRNITLLTSQLRIQFRILLGSLLRVSAYHQKTETFVLESPITNAFSSCLSIFEYNYLIRMTLHEILAALKEWKCRNPEVVQSAKRMMQALFSEGLENALEQMLVYDGEKDRDTDVVDFSVWILRRTGSNLTWHK